MATSMPSRRDPHEVLREASKVLIDFLDAPKPFAISNHSMKDLVTEFSRRLYATETDASALALLRLWRKNLEKSRDVAIQEATKVRFAGGGELPLLTEDKAAYLASVCPPKPEF